MPRCRREFLEGLHPDRATDVVDDDVEEAMCGVERSGDGGLGAFPGLEVGLDGGAAGGCGDLADDLRTVDRDEAPALGGEAERDLPADALRHSGDDRDLVREAAGRDGSRGGEADGGVHGGTPHPGRGARCAQRVGVCGRRGGPSRRRGRR
jgi:hypothetical protein